MILNNPKYVHTQVSGQRSSLPAVTGFFKKEETTRPSSPERVDYIRTTTFVPGIRLLGFILLLLGGVFLVKPADGDRPAQIRGYAATLTVVGLTLILWRRETRHDLVTIEHT